MARQFTIIPAHPGYSVWRIDRDAARLHYGGPVIAWRISADGDEAEPVLTPVTGRWDVLCGPDLVAIPQGRVRARTLADWLLATRFYVGAASAPWARECGVPAALINTDHDAPAPHWAQD
ncbi:hypothetical protein ACLKMY_32885 [Paraburkholderia mimosarum]|uniref:hypothetical protein n=1 Tax=Paraburkholderia mimosarum TaxID=312026 RepID=UPI0039C2D083